MNDWRLRQLSPLRIHGGKTFMLYRSRSGACRRCGARVSGALAALLRDDQHLESPLLHRRPSPQIVLPARHRGLFSLRDVGEAVGVCALVQHRALFGS